MLWRSEGVPTNIGGQQCDDHANNDRTGSKAGRYITAEGMLGAMSIPFFLVVVSGDIDTWCWQSRCPRKSMECGILLAIWPFKPRRSPYFSWLSKVWYMLEIHPGVLTKPGLFHPVSIQIICLRFDFFMLVHVLGCCASSQDCWPSPWLKSPWNRFFPHSTQHPAAVPRPWVFAQTCLHSGSCLRCGGQHPRNFPNETQKGKLKP